MDDTMEANPPRRFQNFREFYPFYLAEHGNRWNRRLHFCGWLAALLILVASAVTLQWWLPLLAPVAGYGLSWLGHFGVERNRPASFRYPLYSFCGDMVMCKDMLTGKIPF